MRYRRAKTEGGTYFFTVNLADRRQSTLVQHVEQLRSAIRVVKERHPFTIEAIVIMPEHLHTIWTLPEGDNDYPTRWALIKAAFSRTLPKGESISKSRCSKGERGIWQRRYWEHLIRDDEDFARHVDYIHFNPVKHGHAVNPIDWVYSSIHRSISAGMLPANWGSSAIEFIGDFGE
jgi:putative transposase